MNGTINRINITSNSYVRNVSKKKCSMANILSRKVNLVHPAIYSHEKK